jgi:hypothetical protein
MDIKIKLILSTVALSVGVAPLVQADPPPIATPTPKLVTLTETVETEYGTLGRGRQMPFVAIESAYVRVQFLDHTVLIPIAATDLPNGDIQPDLSIEAKRQEMIREAIQKRAEATEKQSARPEPAPPQQIRRPMRTVDLPIGRTLDLRQFGGPNMALIVLEVDISALTIALFDYDRLIGFDRQPEVTHRKIPKEDGALVFSSQRMKVRYVDAVDTSQNYVRLGIVSEE